MRLGARSARRAAGLFVLALALAVSSSSVPRLLPPEAPPGPVDFASLPDAPEKLLVLQYCDTCHGLEWIARSGGTEPGWRDRIVRMIRSGATIPREHIPAVAAYLARALPVRPRPDPPRR